MPKCVDCGAETPREEMYGAPDDLRCQTCARKRQEVYESPVSLPQRESAPVVTIGVIMSAIVCSLSFLYQKDSPVPEYLLEDPRRIWDGQLWRFLTSVFPHGHELHLLFNLYWTWRFGREAEGWMGSVLFAGFFVLLALGSSAADFLISGGGIGLSGVGYGLFGLLYALRRDKDFAARQMQPQIVQLFVFWFFLCIVLTYTHVMAVGNVAHGAGAVFGWLIGRSVLARQRNWLLAGICLVALTLVGATLYMPWDGGYAWYRGQRYAEKSDYANALYWYKKAERAFPEDQKLHAYVRWLEQQVEHPQQQ